ncbi:hypothetical protein LTR78_000242 [Recurvomyces mirabilis]|uniref:ATP-dependent DNA ligase family profile domain-containing protein n=1 Tax=Recurvomyces mirabilis TaxID=574656 RepID=A0AAE1C6E5_9PEZI|nr:hypothetical protein LTR78_000242 [Recurvomyces mirabilis]KAK5161898.1 hypothetical protein LTS14_000243 [Recurvomyces mirabilis]
MPFPLPAFALLFSRLEEIETRQPPLLPREKAEALNIETQKWFKSHHRAINELDVPGSVALLSALLPERRTDRVYGIQAQSLCRILCRSLGLTSSRSKELQVYKQPGYGDLGACLERVLKAGGSVARPPVSLEEIDAMLEQLAAQCRFSGPAVKGSVPPSSSEARDKLIGDLLKRTPPEEGKWLVRLILKDFSPVRLNEALVMKSFHFLLPDLLRFQGNFETATRMLKDDLHIRQLPDHPDPRSERLFRQSAGTSLRPLIGVKVSRPGFVKARSIEHCLKMVGTRKWVLERKYDGEYCEIHIDRRRSTVPVECIQIFSKSGKDSTADKKGIHSTLVKCLRLDQSDCKITEQAILLGELVVYSDVTKSVLGFDEIRKHILRSGVFLGTDLDSQPRAHEHLAIVFFDVLLSDDDVVMHKSVNERRQRLRQMYRKIPGRALGAEWKEVNFANSGPARKRLLEQFAASIVQRCEGLVLKPCGVPYFPLDTHHDGVRTCIIKLKKDYIANMGDEADFAVIGASYDAQLALKSGIPGIKWTSFHLGCLTNAVEVRRYETRPAFRVVETIHSEACIPKPTLQALNQLGTYTARPYSRSNTGAPFDVAINTPNIDVLFETPLMVEVLGSGFSKPSNANFYMLRHPRIIKLHQDRSWTECISFQELQEQAHAAKTAPTEAFSELDETRTWVAKLESKLKHRLEKEGTLTPESRRESPRSTKRSAESKLHGATLVDKASQQLTATDALTDTTPCPPGKRRCTAEHCATPPRPSPLSDITNQAESLSSTRQLLAFTKAMVSTKPAVSCRTYGGAGSRNDVVEQHLSAVCSRSKCPFSNAAVFLAPCIRGVPYITEDLLPSHDVLLTASIEHWDRQSFSHAPRTATVSESQAYSGMHKIVLVEAKRPAMVKVVLGRIFALNHGRIRERIELYDWRVLEQCVKHDRQADHVKEHFIGVTMFDEMNDRAIFVSSIPGFGHTG